MTNAFYWQDRNTEQEILQLYEPAARAGFDVLWLDAYYTKGCFPDGMGNYGFPVDRFIDREKYPNGLRPLAEYAHRCGSRFLVWFEPERVFAGTLLDREHPEWLIRLPEDDCFAEVRGDIDAGNRMYHLGDPAALAYMTDFLSAAIEAYHIDILRIDFNFNPLGYWLSGDRTREGEGRLGITEIRYVEGLYQLWDTLLERFPHLTFDNCASGGMRIDLELCARSLPLWRTDAVIFPLERRDLDQAAIQNQLISLGLNRYLPYSASGTMGTEPYYFRSGFNSGCTYAGELGTEGAGLARLAQGIREGKRIRAYYEKDFYVLTKDAGASPENWCVLQYHDPQAQEGIILSFRRQASPFETAVLEPRGLEEGRVYTVSVSYGYEVDEAYELTGAQLMRFRLTLADRPASALIEYRSK